MRVVDAFRPVVEGALRWGGAMATEVLLLPATLRELRGSVGAIAELPGQLAQLQTAFAEANRTLSRELPPMSAAMTDELAPGFAALRDRLDGAHDLALSLAASADPVLAKADRMLDQAPGQLANVETSVAVLADRVDTLWPQLEQLFAQLDGLLPKLQVLEIGELQERVRALDDVVRDLAGTLTTVLASIPGVRRSVTTV